MQLPNGMIQHGNIQPYSKSSFSTLLSILYFFSLMNPINPPFPLLPDTKSSLFYKTAPTSSSTSSSSSSSYFLFGTIKWSLLEETFYIYTLWIGIWIIFTQMDNQMNNIPEVIRQNKSRETINFFTKFCKIFHFPPNRSIQTNIACPAQPCWKQPTPRPISSMMMIFGVMVEISWL